MTTIANTSNGTVTGQVWLNDNATQTSWLVRSSDIAEIVGEMSEEELNNEYSTLAALNADLADFTFSEDAEFTEA
jgi:uncharacterized protein CbrC (UPF0167 family)